MNYSIKHPDHGEGDDDNRQHLQDLKKRAFYLADKIFFVILQPGISQMQYFSFIFATPFAALEARAAVGFLGIEGSITPPHTNSLKSTLYAPRGAVVIRHVTLQEEGL